MEDRSRRSFLKIGGACALGLSALPAINVSAADVQSVFSPAPNALTGKKWAMVIDMKKCWEKGKEGCKDCSQACNHVHNVPDIGNPKDEIKWIWTEHFANAFPGQESEYTPEEIASKDFVILCNHCANPPCTRVCPTQATWKRKEDGVVMMDPHRCIGCRYCMAACPFGSRSFNFRDPKPFVKDPNPKYPARMRGVVEKCTFCEERLAKGQIPACVEACKAKALVFGDLDDPKSEVRKLLHSNYTIRRKPELGTEPNVYYII
ncbi:MAG: sulfate reduction electron transfer complex DsrMKJOP subunit DsrO [Syntrophobacteraceae bacterium]|jgi:molybdopterin-containing oxidoreductase family iron-sulfur binding subunit